jgi:hypothetical protein
VRVGSGERRQDYEGKRKEGEEVKQENSKKKVKMKSKYNGKEPCITESLL